MKISNIVDQCWTESNKIVDQMSVASLRFFWREKKCIQFGAFFSRQNVVSFGGSIIDLIHFDEKKNVVHIYFFSRQNLLVSKAWPASFWREKKWIRKFKFCAGLAYLTIASPMYNFPVWSAAIPLNILEMRMGIRFSRPPLIDIPRPWPDMVLTILTGRTPSGGGPPFPCWSFSVKVCWKYKNFIKIEWTYWFSVGLKIKGFWGGHSTCLNYKWIWNVLTLYSLPTSISGEKSFIT